jgi:adenine-specific DNA methylase
MARLEDLTRGASVRGILSGRLVTVVDVAWFGSAAIELTYKDAAGHLGNELVYRDREPTIELVSPVSLWSFAADGALLRLVSEALRIRWAYLFDGGREQARGFFESGLPATFGRLSTLQSPDYPMTVYYAFKQSEGEDDETAVTGPRAVVASTGWDTMLEGLIGSGLSITGTWPMRTERTGRARDIGSNALASSVVLVCRRRPAEAPIAARREFIAALRKELPVAAYRLYTTCERKGWSQEALAYNSLVVAWPEIARLAGGTAGPSTQEVLL